MEAKYLSNKKLTRLHYPTGSEGLLDSELLILSKVSVSMFKSILNILVTPTKVETPPLAPADEGRIERAKKILKDRKILLLKNGNYLVSNHYIVQPKTKICGCPDYRYRKIECKHLTAVGMFANNNAQ